MDQSTALRELLEAADLLGMIEELTASTSVEKLTPSSTAGLKITLRNVRQTLVRSHDVLAREFVAQARARTQKPSTEQSGSKAGENRSGRSSAMQALAETQRPPIQRNDLRSAMEKRVE